MSCFRWCIALLVITGCLDLTLPSPSAPGRVSATVLVQRPGRASLSPAVGAVLELVGTGRSARADDDGNVMLDGLDSTSGALRLAFDGDGDGVEESARLFDLQLLGAGRGRSVSLGVVVLGRLASASGVVRLGDRLGANGHGGVRVFVPSTPATTFSADDGSWLLEGLPEGQVPVTFFAAGYAPASSPVTLSAGQTAMLPELSLSPSVSAGESQFTGAVRSRGQPVGDALVEATGALVSTTRTDAAGSWALSLSPGVYDLTFLREGFAPVRVQNVLATGEDRVFDIELSSGEVDAGALPAQRSDAGPSISRIPVKVEAVASGTLAPINMTLTVPIPAVARPDDVILLGLYQWSSQPYLPPEFAQQGWRLEASSKLGPNAVVWLSLRVPQNQPATVVYNTAYLTEWLLYVLRGVERAPLVESRNSTVTADFGAVTGAPGDLVINAYTLLEECDATSDTGGLRALARFKALELPIGTSGVVGASTITCTHAAQVGFVTQFRVMARP